MQAGSVGRLLEQQPINYGEIMGKDTDFYTGIVLRLLFQQEKVQFGASLVFWQA